jgi:hypothetical protein
LGGDLASVWS